MYLQCRNGAPTMMTKVQKWGNSLAVRIPKALAEEAGREQGKPVDLRYEDGEVRIRTRGRRRYVLDELLASVPDDFEPKNGTLDRRLEMRFGGERNLRTANIFSRAVDW